MRVEQLYPFPARSLIEELGRFKQAEVIWCQEEPRNMGSWHYIEPNIEWVLDHINAKHIRVRVTPAGPRRLRRPPASSPATCRSRRRSSKKR